MAGGRVDASSCSAHPVNVPNIRAIEIAKKTKPSIDSSIIRFDLHPPRSVFSLVLAHRNLQFWILYGRPCNMAATPSPPVPMTQHAPLSPADAWRNAEGSKASADALYASDAKAALRHYQEAAATLDAICMADECCAGASAADGPHARTMLGTCHLNAALCCNKLQRFRDAEKMASIALG